MHIVLPVSNTLSTEAPRPRVSSDESLIRAWASDGPALLGLTAVGLVVGGSFAWFLALSDQLLPHDLAWLSLSETDLRAVADGRLVAFMAHDRAAFGGTLVAIGVLYLWLVRYPLAAGESWAWWLLTVSGGLGFLTFLSYLGTGYLDTWHGLATLALLVPFLLGVLRTAPPRPLRAGLAVGWAGRPQPRRNSRGWLGRGLLLLTGFGMLVAGATIVTIGSLVVFVPQDLGFLRLDHAALHELDARLVPLIAHDRAGFGGGLAVIGLVTMGCVAFAPISRSLWEALLLAGLAGFGAAIGIHVVIGYTDLTHVGPAILGAMVFAAGMVLTPVRSPATPAKTRPR